MSVAVQWPSESPAKEPDKEDESEKIPDPASPNKGVRLPKAKSNSEQDSDSEYNKNYPESDPELMSAIPIFFHIFMMTADA